MLPVGKAVSIRGWGAVGSRQVAERVNLAVEWHGINLPIGRVLRFNDLHKCVSGAGIGQDHRQDRRRVLNTDGCR